MAKKNDKILKEVETSIIQDLEDYYSFYQKPVKASDIGKRCGKRLKAIDMTVTTLLRQMDGEKKVALLMASNMTRYVMPYSVWEGMSKEEQFVFCNRLDQRNHAKTNDVVSEGVEKTAIPADKYF